MWKAGDIVFVPIKFINSENSFVIDIRKRVIQSQYAEVNGGWWLTDIEGNAKGFAFNDSLFKTKKEALEFLLNQTKM